MPITSKYSDEKFENILTEVAAVLEKHGAGPDLSLMIAGNIATNVINKNVGTGQRKAIAEKFAQALMSSIEDKAH
ncbi:MULTISPECIES: YejL family protein [Vibrio]|uniref:YejL family protein n=1 Tax=Vibrio TaxID=662 RepID=UPI0021A87499|nr:MULTISPECIES: YejL family protein [Vibrio]MDA0147040.1 YejL family protein [Vibrio sp. LaRot3]